MAVVGGAAVFLGFLEVGFGGEIDVLKEGTGAGFFCGVGEFVFANRGDDGADGSRREVGGLVVEKVFFDGVIEGARHLSFAEGESDGDDEKAAAHRGVQDGFAIRKMEIRFG